MELIHNKDGFWCVVCVCRLDGVYVGCGWGKKLMMHWAWFFKELGFKHPTIIGFLDFFNVLVGQVYDWKN